MQFQSLLYGLGYLINQMLSQRKTLIKPFIENNRVRPFTGVKWNNSVSLPWFILAECLVHRLNADSSFEKSVY